MLKIRTTKEIEGNSCELYDPKDNLIGTIDSALSLTDICVQIKKIKADGFYLKHGKDKENKTIIESNGTIFFGRGKQVFTATGDILRELIC